MVDEPTKAKDIEPSILKSWDTYIEEKYDALDQAYLRALFPDRSPEKDKTRRRKPRKKQAYRTSS